MHLPCWGQYCDRRITPNTVGDDRGLEAIADRVLVIHNSGLVFDGTAADFRANGSLEERFCELTSVGTAEFPNAPRQDDSNFAGLGGRR